VPAPAAKNARFLRWVALLETRPGHTVGNGRLRPCCILRRSFSTHGAADELQAWVRQEGHLVALTMSYPTLSCLVENSRAMAATAPIIGLGTCQSSKQATRRGNAVKTAPLERRRRTETARHHPHYLFLSDRSIYEITYSQTRRKVWPAGQ
jgi:hypothetical protein